MKSIIGIVVTICACVLIVVTFAFGIPFAKYCHAVDLQNRGQIIEAYDAFVAMDGYRDSAERAAALYDQYKIEKFKTAKVGDYIYFGVYEQDNDFSNGPEDIQWQILAIEDGKALVISKYGLSSMQYHTRDEGVTWENCTLREWLNTAFLEEVFSPEEQARLVMTTVEPDVTFVNQEHHGESTEDRLFILSYTETVKYMTDLDARRGIATKRAIAEGSDANNLRENCWWWTRTSARNPNEVLTVDSHGEINRFGDNVSDAYYAVRPAMWVQLGDS